MQNNSYLNYFLGSICILFSFSLYAQSGITSNDNHFGKVEDDRVKITNRNSGPIQPNSKISLSINSAPSMDGTEQNIVNITYVVHNRSEQPMENLVLEVGEHLQSGQQYISNLSPIFNGDPNNNGILDPGEFWFYSARKSYNYDEGETFILQGSVIAESELGVEVGAYASFLHGFGSNVQVNIIQEYANPGDSIDVEFITRLKIDEELAKDPGTTFIMVGDTIFEVPLPKSHWEARNVHLKILGLYNDEYLPIQDISELTLYCDQDFVDSGRNLEDVLDECESIDTRNPVCDSTSTEGFCEFPEWVFCMRMEVPQDFEGDNFIVTAFDSMEIWKADEFPADSGMYNDFEDLSMIVEPVEMDLDSILIGSVNTDDQNIAESNYFKVYPNPFNEIINIKAIDVKKTAIAEVYDLNGKLLYQTKIQKEIDFDLHHLSDGYYIVVFKEIEKGSILQIESLVKG